jgi:hypothetical protein
VIARVPANFAFLDKAFESCTILGTLTSSKKGTVYASIQTSCTVEDFVNSASNPYFTIPVMRQGERPVSSLVKLIAGRKV